ncbi:hypothetical protein HDV03_001399 [Kappamyces sp. JEL0829]|nr:hypothetical protein HDV03_001399 [Kappamyces sp. JEL0829]KAJ3346587.1 hypothetical protein HDU91_006995 [Kappamyces sp. JEL0680]
MGGGGHYQPPLGKFVAPKIAGRGAAVAIGACYWFFLGYRIYQDGGHHFLHKHAWEDPRIIKYLDEVDAKYGTRLGLDNMHH